MFQRGTFPKDFKSIFGSSIVEVEETSFSFAGVRS